MSEKKLIIPQETLLDIRQVLSEINSLRQAAEIIKSMIIFFLQSGRMPEDANPFALGFSMAMVAKECEGKNAFNRFWAGVASFDAFQRSQAEAAKQ